MSLILKNIVKDYPVKDNAPVKALKGISLTFPETGFIAILGQSGCGKTTLLNLIGGLDKYTSGDIIINGQSTKDYTDQDWDSYRNHEVGIVFQSYNLIPHLTVLGNVELAMALNGVSDKEREKRAKDALTQVGLEDQVMKNPNQLSGGQMQRVAIARALVNDPNFILADEPTGALDSKTSVQVMDVLKKTSQTKLVIVVTHNEGLAEKYANRIIVLSDGQVISDKEMGTKALPEDEEKPLPEQAKPKHTSMSYKTAIGISGKNLLTKKAKTIVTAVAASFGIIGVGLVLALSNGFSNYVNRMEAQTLSKFPLTIEKYGYNYVENSANQLTKYPSDDIVHVVEPATSQLHVNNITSDYVSYLEAVNTEKKTYAKFRFNYSIGMHVISKYTDTDSGSDVYTALNTSQSSYLSQMASSLMGSSSSAWQELPADQEKIMESYDVISGSYPSEELQSDDYGTPNQSDFGLVLVVNSRNALTTTTMDTLGLNPKSGTYTFEELMDTTKVNFQYVQANDFYGDAISQKDAEGNPTYTTGLFFKDSVSINEISSIVTKALADTSDTTTLATLTDSLSNDMDLPDLDKNSSGYEGDKIIDELKNDTTFTNTLASMTDRGYLNKDKIQSLQDGTTKIDTSTMTVQTIRSYLNDAKLASTATDYEANRADFGALLDKAVLAALETKTLKSHFKRNHSYYNNPTSQETLAKLYSNQTGKNRTLHIACILRPKQGSSLGMLSSGVYYPKSLTYQTFTDNAGSAIAKEYKNHIFIAPSAKTDYSKVFTSAIDKIYVDTTQMSELVSAFTSTASLSMLNIINSLTPLSSITTYMNARLELGSDVVLAAGSNLLDEKTYASFVSTISIYLIDYNSKAYVTSYLDKYNTTIAKDESEKIVYTDVGQVATDTVGQIVQVISAVLIAFASISLVVSSVMLAILIYSSVVERTKEIGILRSIGARKKDVGRLFKAEGIIIGFLAGVFGVMMTYLISLPISATLNHQFPDVSLGQIAFLNPLHAVGLIALSVALTYLASLAPARYASNKDPVTCLRSE